MRVDNVLYLNKLLLLVHRRYLFYWNRDLQLEPRSLREQKLLVHDVLYGVVLRFIRHLFLDYFIKVLPCVLLRLKDCFIEFHWWKCRKVLRLDGLLRNVLRYLGYCSESVLLLDDLLPKTICLFPLLSFLPQLLILFNGKLPFHFFFLLWFFLQLIVDALFLFLLDLSVSHSGPSAFLELFGLELVTLSLFLFLGFLLPLGSQFSIYLLLLS